MNTGETEGFENLITVVELHIKELNTSAFQNVFPDIGFYQFFIPIFHFINPFLHLKIQSLSALISPLLFLLLFALI